MSAPQVCSGLEVAKAQRDSALRPTGERWAGTNEETGMAARVAWLQAVQPMLMGLEATGGNHRAVVAAHIAWRDQRVAPLANDLDTRRRANPIWHERETLSRRVPGMGPVCARPLGLALPELGP